jgi:hypothetical protein
MRFQRLKLLALGGAAALVVLAAVLAFATGSRAAGANICSQPSATSPTGRASCVTELVAPHFIFASTSHALSITKFHNEAVGGATATHVLLSVTFPDTTAVTIVGTPAVFVAAPGSSTFNPFASTCTKTTDSQSHTVESCTAGNIPGDGQAKMVVEFTGSSGGQLTGEAAYGEGGGNPSNPPNDDQVNFDNLTLGGAANGGCFPSDQLPPSITGTGTLQQTQLSGVGANNISLPCTFIDAGVKAVPDGFKGPGVTQISFVEFPSFGAVATVYMILTPIPTGFNLNNASKSPIFEDTSGTGSFSSFVTVPACDKNGNIVGAIGIPPAGNDSCVFARTSLGKGNGEIGIHVFLANPFDQTYKG